MLAKFEDGALFELEDADALLDFSFSMAQRILCPAFSQLLTASPTAHTILLRMGLRRMHSVAFFAAHMSGMLSDAATSTAELVSLLHVRFRCPRSGWGTRVWSE